ASFAGGSPAVPPSPPSLFHGGPSHKGAGCLLGGFPAGVSPGAVGGAPVAPAYAYPAPVYPYPAPAYAPPPPPTYWYYCQSLGAYYPYVPNCPEPWVPVLAQ